MSKMRVIKKNLEIDMMSSSSSGGGCGDNDDEETQKLTTFSSSSSLQVTDDDYPPQHDNDAIIFSQHQQNQRRRHHHIFRIKNIKNLVIIIAALLLLIVMGGLLISSNSSSSDSDDDDSSSSSGGLKIDDPNKMYIKRNSNNNIIKIACAGDSLTLGSFGGTEPGGDYPTHLRNKLDNTKKESNNDFDIHNFGRNGATAFSGIPPSYNATEQFQNSLDFNSDIYLLMLGSNDLSSWYDFDDREQKFIQDMEWIINKVRESSSLSSEEEEDQTTTNTPIRNKPRIILAKPPWVKRESRPDGTKIDIIQQEEMPILERLAIKLDGLTLVDMYSVTVGHNEYYQPDEIHLISDGYNILANVWKDAILCDNNNICEIGEDCNTCPNDCQINCPP